MQEDFLHFIWKYKKFNILKSQTTEGDYISITNFGVHNHDSGPDFFNAQIVIGEQLWAGYVEIHIKSSDWYLHNHEKDINYDNVILHVVWEHDTDIFRKDKTAIPTLELKGNISKDVMLSYEKLFLKGEKWINCENDFANTNDFII